MHTFKNDANYIGYANFIPPPMQQQQQQPQQHNHILATNYVQMANAVQLGQNDVARQIAEAQQQIQLLNLQRQLEQMQVRRFDFKAFEAMTIKFTGDDTFSVKKWLENLDEAFTMFNCNEGDKLVAAKRVVDGTAKVVLRSIQVKSYNEFKQLMIERFDRELSSLEVYQQLKTRKINKSETAEHYLAIMEEIASHVEMPECKVIDCIIESLQDNTRDAMILYTAKTSEQVSHGEYKRKGHNGRRWCRTRSV